MNLKTLISQATYGTIGYVSSFNDIKVLEQYIIYNSPVLEQFQHIIVATNFSNIGLVETYNSMWKRYFPNCTLLTSKINRGHNFGTADLDNMVFDFCKENNMSYLCKASNDILLQSSLLDKEIEVADFYYLNGISYRDLCLNSFNFKKIYSEHFYPQTNFYIINVSKCDYLNDKAYLDETYNHIQTVPNYNGKIWEYIDGWTCEDFLKNCVERNNLSKQYLLDLDTHLQLCESINTFKIGDSSHKNIMVNGVCHYHFPQQQFIKI